MIGRRLSVPPEQRIVRLPHTVGQVRLVGVPDLSRCCIYDEFFRDPWWSYPTPMPLALHKPNQGRPWQISAPYLINEPRIGDGVCQITSSVGEADRYAGGMVLCTQDVHVEAKITTGGTDGYLRYVTLPIRWDGEVYGDGTNNALFELFLGLAPWGIEGRTVRAVFIARASPTAPPTYFVHEEDIPVAQYGGDWVDVVIDAVGSSVTYKLSHAPSGWKLAGKASAGVGEHKGVGFMVQAAAFYRTGILSYRACPL